MSPRTGARFRSGVAVLTTLRALHPLHSLPRPGLLSAHITDAPTPLVSRTGIPRVQNWLTIPLPIYTVTVRVRVDTVTFDIYGVVVNPQ
jgi:hypothetical protein